MFPRKSADASLRSAKGFALGLHFLTLCVAFALAIATPVRATVLIGADVGELARDAIAIVRGHVIAVDPQWTDDHRAIETMVTLEVDGYLKGDLGATVQFRVPGGDVGRYRSIVMGAPQFDVDQRVILFLGARGPSVPYVLGLSQGVFRIVGDDASGLIVTPPPILPSASSAPVRIVRGDPSRRPLPLAEFESRVRALVREGK
jgi:hypothetical protein